MIKLNPNVEIVNAIKERLKATGGFCPCKPEHLGEANYFCPCKEFREHKKCCCELYVEVKDDQVPFTE